MAAISWRARKAEFLWALVKKELDSTIRVPWSTRLRLWRHGFLSASHVCYELDRRDRREFVTDYQRLLRTPFINGEFAPVLDNKLIFQRVIAAHLNHLPTIWGIIADGRATFLGGAGRHDPAQFVDDLLERHDRIVLKTVTGGGGQSLRVISKDDGMFRVNEVPCEKSIVSEWAAAPARLLVGEFIEQHPDLAALFGGTLNTVRVLTMQDREDGPFIAAAALKMGRRESIPVDNWAKGGLCAPVDVETGRVGAACSYPAYSDRLTWYEAHPETGAAIEGLVLPHWNLILDQLLQLLRSATYLRYVGWDVAITRESFKLVEGNSYPDLTLFQLHRPLLTNPRIRAFYQRNRVLSARG